MAMVINLECGVCGCPLTLDCGEVFLDAEPAGAGKLLDLTLECGNCDAPVLNAFVPTSSFQPLED